MHDPSVVEAIFLKALEKPLEERAKYLDEACQSDADLRCRLEQLLEAHPKAVNFLESNPFDAASPQPDDRVGDRVAVDQFISEPTVIFAPPGEKPGTVVVGRYKLLEQIGEGGMGTVWVAEQTVPVRRKVALKLIRAGMDSKSILSRFEAERQALAVLDHPNIAKVLDGGTLENGRPFFVMEYVKGVPITEYCDSAKLKVDERLSLFVQVCSAVQHAHQKGIIHRDLKPSNILVAPYDDHLVPKIIDFGLAKAMYQSLTERTLHTAHETVLGTPLYMSPEQAQLNNLDVDTRSDIYSLGVLLYELLTGTTPLEQKRFKEAAWDEIKRIIREEDPPRPSVRLSSTQTLPSLAACRQSEPLALTKQVRGELDWIVMKALEKDRNRRYQTANGFAADVQRFLGGEPVQAVPPSTGYRFRKFLRRHRGIVTATVAVALVLVLGTAISTWQAVRAIRAEKLAVDEGIAATKARDLEARARQEEAQARQRAEQAEREALLAREQEQRARRAAEADRDATVRALNRAEGLRLSAEASAARQTDPSLSLLLAIEAVRKLPNHLTYAVLYDSFAACNEQQVLSKPMQTIGLARIFAGGESILTTGNLTTNRDDRKPFAGILDHARGNNPGSNVESDRPFGGVACVWSSSTGQLQAIWKGFELPVSDLDISPAGTQVAVTIQGSCHVTFPQGHQQPRALFTDRVACLFDPKSGDELIHLRRHDDRIVSVRFNSNGTKVVTASWDRTARIWDVATGTQLHVLRGHECSLFQAMFNPAGDRVLTVSANRIDNTEGYEQSTNAKEGLVIDPGVMDLSSATLQQGSLSTSGSSLAGEEKLARIYDVETGTERVSLTKKRPGALVFGHVWHPVCARFSPDGKKIAIGFAEDVGAVWDSESGGLEKFVLRGHTGQVSDIAYSPNGLRIATAGSDRTARIWDAQTGKELHRLAGHQDVVRSVRFSPDGKRVLTASPDRTARLWDAATGEELAVFRGHANAVLSAEFHPSMPNIVTAGDSTARIWRYSSPVELATVIRGHTGALTALEFSPDGQRLLTAAEDETPQISDCASGKSLLRIGKDKLLGAIRSAQFVAGGTQVLTASATTTSIVNGKMVSSSAVHLWDSQNGHDLLSLSGHETSAAWSIASRDGKLLMTASDGSVRTRSRGFLSTDRSIGGSLSTGIIRTWNAKTGDLLATLPKAIDGANTQFSLDGRRVVLITEQNRQVCLFDAKTGADVLKLPADDGLPQVAILSPNGERLIVATDARLLVIYDVKDGRRLQKLDLPGGNATLASIRPDGRRIVVATDHATAVICDLEEFQIVCELKSHEGRLNSILFSPDGKTIATASEDQTAALWDAETGRMLSLYRGHTEAVSRIAFSPDGRHLATGSADSTARIWPLDLWPDILERRTRNLTPAEMLRYEIH